MSKKRNREPAPQAPKSAAMNKVTHRGYTIVQSPRNHHVMIGKDGHMVYHASFDHPLTDEELRKRVDDYINVSEVLA